MFNDCGAEWAGLSHLQPVEEAEVVVGMVAWGGDCFLGNGLETNDTVFNIRGDPLSFTAHVDSLGKAGTPHLGSCDADEVLNCTMFNGLYTCMLDIRGLAATEWRMGWGWSWRQEPEFIVGQPDKYSCG